MTPDPANTPRPRKRRLWRWLLLAVGLLVLFPIGVISSLNWYGERRFQAELDKIRARGEPVDAAGLEAMRGTPEKDLTNVYLGVFAKLEAVCPDSNLDAEQIRIPFFGILSSTPPLPHEPWPDIRLTEKLLERIESPLNTLHDAASRKGEAKFKLEFGGTGQGYFGTHYAGLRLALRCLLLDCYYHAYKSDWSASYKSMRATVALVETIRDEPNAMPLMMWPSSYRAILDCLQQLVPHAQWTSNELEQLQQQLRCSFRPVSVRRTFIGERVAFIMVFAKPEQFLTPKPVQWREWLRSHGINVDSAREERAGSGLLWRFDNADRFCRYCDALDKFIAVADQPWPIAHAEAARIDSAVDSFRESQGFQALRFECLTDCCLPSLADFVTNAARATSFCLAADAAIGAELYRRKHGELPEKVEQLVPEFLPEVPLDPFDGQPIRYVVREDKYVFYSVGPDGKDDGAPGPDPDDVDGNGPDIEFAVKRKVK